MSICGLAFGMSTVEHTSVGVSSCAFGNLSHRQRSSVHSHFGHRFMTNSVRKSGSDFPQPGGSVPGWIPLSVSGLVRRFPRCHFLTSGFTLRGIFRAPGTNSYSPEPSPSVITHHSLMLPSGIAGANYSRLRANRARAGIFSIPIFHFAISSVSEVSPTQNPPARSAKSAAQHVSCQLAEWRIEVGRSPVRRSAVRKSAFLKKWPLFGLPQFVQSV